MENVGSMVGELLSELAVHPLPGTPLTNYMVFLLISFVATLAFFLVASRRLSLVPRGIGNVVEAGYEFVRDGMVGEVIGPAGRPYVPFVAAVFFFVLFNNLLGLIPGFKAGTGTMGTTVTWGIVVFIVYNAIGVKRHGVWGYLKSFYPSGVVAPLAVFVMLLEMLSHVVRPFTLAIRLFANMYAGHIILGIFSIFTVVLWDASAAGKLVSALPLAMQVLVYALEVFVAIIQAYVFAILTTVYIAGAVHAGEH